jgi:hypothetical protein
MGLRVVSLAYGPAAESGANAAALLAWLPRLQELSSLQLRAVTGLCAIWDNPHYPSATAYRALTMGSNLQQIDLRDTGISAGAWQCAFQHGDMLTSITDRVCSQVIGYAHKWP